MSKRDEMTTFILSKGGKVSLEELCRKFTKDEIVDSVYPFNEHSEFDFVDDNYIVINKNKIPFYKRLYYYIRGIKYWIH